MRDRLDRRVVHCHDLLNVLQEAFLDGMSRANGTSGHVRAQVLEQQVLFEASQDRLTIVSKLGHRVRSGEIGFDGFFRLEIIEKTIQCIG